MGVDLFIKLMIGIVLVGIVIKSIKLIGKIFFRFFDKDKQNTLTKNFGVWLEDNLKKVGK